MRKGNLILGSIIVMVLTVGGLAYYNYVKSRIIVEKEISFVERVKEENKNERVMEDKNDEASISKEGNKYEENNKNETHNEANDISNNINNVIEENINKPLDDVEEIIDNMNIPNNNYDGNGSDAFLAEVERLIFEKVNAERQNIGLQVYSYNNSMEKYARIKSEDMGVRGYFDHSNPEGELITVTMSRDGVGYNAWGENIAYITGSTDPNFLASQFMNNWMNSEGHRANILSTNFTDIGVGVYSIGGAIYATQEFYR